MMQHCHEAQLQGYDYEACRFGSITETQALTTGGGEPHSETANLFSTSPIVHANTRDVRVQGRQARSVT